MVSFRALIVPLLCVVACCCAGGCHSYETRAYDVMVRNDSPVPIVVWLTKDGPPYEQAWLSPEDIAIETPQQRDEQRLEVGRFVAAELVVDNCMAGALEQFAQALAAGVGLARARVAERDDRAARDDRLRRLLMRGVAHLLWS